ncbi:hypothetical protein ACSDR0_48310, partial [Streptosporangium sp. G11]
PRHVPTSSRLLSAYVADCPESAGHLTASANGQLAAATYRCPPGGHAYEPFGIGVMLVRDGRITEIVAFHEPALFPSFNLPPTLDR